MCTRWDTPMTLETPMTQSCVSIYVGRHNIGLKTFATLSLSGNDDKEKNFLTAPEIRRSDDQQVSKKSTCKGEHIRAGYGQDGQESGLEYSSGWWLSPTLPLPL